MCRTTNNHLTPATAIMKLKALSGKRVSAHEVLMIVPDHKALEFLDKAGAELAKLLIKHRYAYKDPAILNKLDELAPAT